MSVKMDEPLSSSALEAERTVLGCMLIDPRCVPLVTQALRPEDFSGTENRTVYEAVCAIFRRGGAVDASSLLEELGSQHRDSLLQMIEIVPTAANVEEYVRLLTASGR